MANLTPKQQRFVAEYLVDLNATQAAIRAGYSEKTGYSQGQRLLKNVEVRKQLEQAGQDARSESIAKAQEVLEMLTRSMRREEKESVVIKTKQKKSYYDKAGKKVVEEKEVPEVVEIPSKLSDAIRAAEALGKYHALFTDRMELDGGITIAIDGIGDTKERDDLMG